jgi:hypothetical protein
MRWRVVAVAIASAVLGALVTVAVMRGTGKHEEAAPPAEGQKPERVTVEGGETIVSLDAATASRSHLTIAPLQPVTRTEASRSFATAVDVRDLVDARNQFAVARAQREQAQAHLAAAEAEYKRLQALHNDNRNISDRVLQEAEANVRVERANADVASATMTAAESAVRQRWGNEVAAAFAMGRPWVDDVMANRSVLVQVVSAQQPPPTIALQTPNRPVKATFVSMSPRTDPRVQGRSWLYVAPAGEIVPGMTLSAAIGTPRVQQGALVPRDAVVWTDSRPWIYVERSANRFARHPIDTSAPMSDAYFVTTLAPGQRAVVGGAQQLLSEEAKPRVEE